MKYTTYSKRWGQSHVLHRTRSAAEKDIERHTQQLRKGGKRKPSDRVVVVVSGPQDLMFYDEACKQPVWKKGFHRKAIETFWPAVKSESGKPQTVRQALDEKRKQLAGKVTALNLCCNELFYYPSPGDGVGNSVYPVSLTTAEAEAQFFGCEVTEV